MPDLIEAEHRFPGAPIRNDIAAATERRRHREHLERELTGLNGLIAFHRDQAATAIANRARIEALLRGQAP